MIALIATINCTVYQEPLASTCLYVVSFVANVNLCVRYSRSSSLYVVARPSVCRLKFMRPTQPVEIFGNVFTPFGILAIRWHPGKILRRSSQGNPSVGCGKRKRGSQIKQFWIYRRLYLGNGARYDITYISYY